MPARPLSRLARELLAWLGFVAVVGSIPLATRLLDWLDPSRLP